MMEIPQQDDLQSLTTHHILTYPHPTPTHPPRPNPSNHHLPNNKPPTKPNKSQKKNKPKPTKPPKTIKHHKVGHNRQTRTKATHNGKFLQYISNKYSIFMMIGIVFVLVFYRLLDIVTEGKQKFDISLDIHEQDQYMGISIKQLGLADFPQVGTTLDVFGIAASSEYKEFSDKYRQKYRYAVFRPNIRKQTNINHTNNTHPAPKTLQQQTQTQLCSKILQISPELYQNALNNTRISPQLAQDICNQLTYQQAVDIQSRYADRVYGISSMQQQPALCVLSYGLSGYDEDMYAQYVQGILQQDYSKYRVIVIDDYTSQRVSPMNAMVRFFGKYDKFMVVTNRLRVGKVGSYFLHAEHCMKCQRSVYWDQNVQNYWFHFQKFQSLDVLSKIFYLPYQYPLSSKILNYRTESYKLHFSQLIAHRTQLIGKLPLQHFIEYHKNRKNRFWSPSFHKSKQKKLLIYSLLELCGEKHTQFIDHFMYVEKAEKDRVPSPCENENNALTQSKSSLKIPMLPLDSLRSNPTHTQNYTLNPLLLNQLQLNYNNYSQCMQNKLHVRK